MNFITFSLHEYNSYLLILLAAIFENGSSCYFIVWNTGKKKNQQLIAKPLKPFYARHCGNCADGFACAIEIVVKSVLNFTASVRCSIMKARRYFLRPVSTEQDTTGQDRQGQTWTGISFADATQNKPNYTLLSLFPDTYKENQPRGGVANGRNSP